MKKRSGLLLTLLLSLLMIFGTFGLAVFADDDTGETGENTEAAEEESAIGISSSTHTINITNYTGDKIRVNGVRDSGGFVLEQGSGTMEYTEPDALISIETKSFIKFTGTVPYYTVYPSTENGYKYCFEFEDGQEYTGDLNLTIEKDDNGILLAFDANYETGDFFYMVSEKKAEVDLSNFGFEREGYELVGWALAPDAEEPAYACDYVAHPSKDYTFYAVWEHAHEWSLTKTGSNTATLECLNGNDACEYYENPVTLTLSAEDSRYDGSEYDSEDLVTLSTGDREIPDDVIEPGDLVFKNILGWTIDTPTDAGCYTASVTYSLNDGSGDSITLKDSFRIKRAGNVRYGNIIENWTEGDEPNKPDTSWAKSKKPLVLYMDEEDAFKLAEVIVGLDDMDSISIADFKDVNVSILPPTKAGSYMIIVVGLTKNYVDVGLQQFDVEGKTGVMEVEINGWTYGEYDKAVNGPAVTIDDKDVTDSSEIDYRPLFSSYDEYTTFDPDEADRIDAGTYMMRVRVVDNSTDETHKMIKLFRVKKAYCYTNEPMAIQGLVADGNAHKLVTEGKCEYEDGSENDNCWFMYSMTTSLKRPITYGEDIPTASEAGTYYVWYVFCSENNNYYSYVSVFPLKVVIADPMDDPEEDPEEPVVDPDPAEEPVVDPEEPVVDPEEPAEVVTVPEVAGFAVKPAKKAVKVKWSKPEDISSISYVEIQYSRDKSFSKAKTVKVSRNKASYKIKKLKKAKKYYVRMQFVKMVDGEKYESGWTAAKKVKTK